MSSSSSALAYPLLPGCSDESARIRARMLAGVAWETAAIGSEISLLGATLSADGVALDDGHRMQHLQAFDRLAQWAHAQAQLVAHLAREILMERPSDVTQMLELVDSIPLYDVRTRLREALGSVQSHEHSESGTADLWD